MALSNTLLLSYQIEYQTTDITILELCEKYNISTKDLKGYTKWEKENLPEVEAEETIVTDIQTITEPTTLVEESKTIVTDIQTITEPLGIEPDSNTNSEVDKLRDDINSFKTKAMAECLRWMDNDAEYGEVKEFKDIVSIVDKLEQSISDKKPENETPQIQIQINNIMSKYAD